jgi:hypothetical protein
MQGRKQTYTVPKKIFAEDCGESEMDTDEGDGEEKERRWRGTTNLLSALQPL